MISFDVFDTAIIRTVFEPKDVFYLLDKKLGNNFAQKRIEAEDNIRKEDPYYTLEDIYKLLPEFSMEEEVQLEIDCARANKDILDKYNEDPENCVFISDMYLTSDKIKAILESVGYKDPKVFVSCEMKAYKASGALFRKVEEVTGKQITKHYGDNYMADIVGAKKAGIPETIFKPALQQYNLSLPAVHNPVLEKLFAITEVYGSAEEQLVFHVSPLVSEFTKWVLSKRKEGQKIFFLSRDMYVPYRLATEVLHEKDTYYIYASRKALAPFIKKSKNKSLKEHFGVMNLEGISKKNTAKEVHDYFKRFNIQDGDLLVDIGYSGTVQACIDEMFNIKTKGLYIQINSKLDGIATEMFLSRPALIYYLIIESSLGSPEDCVAGYRNGAPIFTPENENRKEQAKRLTDMLFAYSSGLLDSSISVHDVEQALIHLQFYPSSDLLDLFNEQIYSNKRVGESIIGFNKDEIMKGNLFDLYNNSYAQPLFLRMLREDKELKHLEKLL